MFKRSKNKIVAAIMSVLVCLFLGTLAVIFISSYFEVSRENYKMLEHHAQIYILPEIRIETDSMTSLMIGWM